MGFLKLSNIGKIYVSEGNVAVGIRGVNLEFELGEFVAITGASGSGKSTLLNVLSGMDSYEEGELFIEGKPTSHYLQTDWEEYREKYISFIFQDYNIIDSFTVLQNVELALMTITDPLERRKRAIELIERVGLKSHMKHKGSQLSGGQKQRTVIARALAKDSPIILADEPTGNLDSETSKEIVALLREVSKDKLLIMVTHNFEQVEDVATRHVRVFDGAIESDRVLRKTNPVELTETGEEIVTPGKERLRTLSNGFLLGRSIFFSKPQLSIFLCLLLLIGSFAVFFATTFCGDFTEMFKSFYLFRREPGRLIVVHQEEAAFTDDEIEKLVSSTGAEGYCRYDYLYDTRMSGGAPLRTDQLDLITDEEIGHYICVPMKDVGSPDIGRYPQTKTEVMLILPIFYKVEYGDTVIAVDTLDFYDVPFQIVGIKYYADKSVEPRAMFTQEGFDLVTTIYGFDGAVSVSEYLRNGKEAELTLSKKGSSLFFIVSPELPENAIYIRDDELNEELKRCDSISLSVSTKANYERNAWSQGRQMLDIYEELFNSVKEKKKGITLTKEQFLFDQPDVYMPGGTSRYTNVLIGEGVAKELLDNTIKDSYKQLSLFFPSDRAAKKAAKELKKQDYVAVTTKETYKADFMTMFELILSSFMQAVVWFLIVVFVAFFVNLCSHKSVEAFKDDLSIMRSMGIPVKVIRTGIYVRMFLALLPAFVLIPVVAYFLYHDPQWNLNLYYIKPWNYLILYLGMILLTLRVTRKQIKSLFSESVKKSLKGGEDV